MNLTKKEKLRLLQQLVFIDITSFMITQLKTTEAKKERLFKIWNTLKEIKEDAGIIE
jgi:hypothetical protein